MFLFSYLSLLTEKSLVLFAEHKAIYQTIKLLDYTLRSQHNAGALCLFVCLFLLCFEFEAAVDTQAIIGLYLHSIILRQKD
jgi:hypothetical protein